MIRRWLQRQSLETNLSLSTAVLVLVLIGLTMVVLHERLATTLEQALDTRARTISRSIAAVSQPNLLSYNYAALQLAADASAAESGVLYVIIHDKEGVPAGVSGSRLPEQVREPLSSIDGEIQAMVRPLAGDNGLVNAYEIGMPIFVSGTDQPWGLVRVGLSYEPILVELQRLKLSLILLGLVLSVGATTAVRLIARRSTAGLRKLLEGTEALSSGQMGVRIGTGGSREFAELSRAFNTMMDRVSEKAAESAGLHKSLETLNTTLEEQVRERTQELEESVLRYRTLVMHSPDSILIVQDGRVRFVNSRFTEIFGIDEDAAIDDDFLLESLFETSSGSLVQGRIAAWQRGEHAAPVAVIAHGDDGQVRELELRGSGIEYLGQPAAECLLVDFTENKRLREKLNETERLRALGELAGGVAHDFNNLLSAVLGRAQLLRREDLPEKVDRSLAVIEKSAQDGRETVRRIQEFSRVRRDRAQTPLDLSQIVRDSLELTQTRWEDEAASRNVTIQVEEFYKEVPPVLGHDSEFREVFTNLILNAIDAMPQGGTLRASCQLDGTRVVAEVSDSGVGMTDDIRRHLFDPFFSTKGTSGTGLGLSVVYGIVNRHHGTIDVETSPGRGTIFRVEFPAAFDAMLPEEDVMSEAHETTRTGHILVIDDDPAIAELLEMTLQSVGHRVDVANSGAEGVRMAGAGEYDLIFSDLGMPDLSGWEVAEQIFRDKPAQPLILVTGWGATLEDSELERRGITEVVHKPFDINDLIEVTARTITNS